MKWPAPEAHYHPILVARWKPERTYRLMPTIRLTQLAADKIAPPATGRIVYWDRLLPGFGLRVTANGAKSWIASYRLADGRKVMETIAPLARLPRVDDARQAARTSMEKAAGGNNPVAEKRTEATHTAANTVGAAATRYLDHCDRNLKPKTAREWRRIFEHDVLPRWVERPLAEITKGDVLELVNDKGARRERKRKGLTEGAAVQANRTLTRLRTFFGWAAANDLVAADPTAGVRKPAKETARDRVLTDDEIIAFWNGTEKLGLPFGAVFRLMLLTAQREGEVAGMRWSEIDLDGRTWTIPGSRAKNGKPHVVALCGLAIEALELVPHIVGQDLLFSGNGLTPVSGFSSAKARLDAAMGVNDWVLHDLRRTATTGLARLGIAPHVADRVLGHTAGVIRGVMATYNRFEYLDERRAALETWGRQIKQLIGRGSQNVVTLRRAVDV
jgi:integrase